MASRYNNIQDCWNAFEGCETFINFKRIAQTFPNKFGVWGVEYENGWAVITNYWYDSNTASDEEETRVFEIKE